MEKLSQKFIVALERDLKRVSEKDRNPNFIVSVEEVIKAHYLICSRFETEEGKSALYGIRDYNLLVSALSRQVVIFSGEEKYTNPLDKCATLYFGLVKNHAFHDANKRIALLTALYALAKIGRYPTNYQDEFERLTVLIASSGLPKGEEVEIISGLLGEYAPQNRIESESETDLMLALINAYEEPLRRLGDE